MVRKLPACEQSFTVWDSLSGQLLWRGPLSPVVKVPPSMTIIVSASDKFEKHDDEKYLITSTNTGLGDVKALRCSPSVLPDRWYAYSMAKIMVLGGVKPRSMRPAQRQAILDWVQRGGVLILAGSSNMSETLKGGLGSAAGVGVVGVHHVSSLKVVGPGLENTPEVTLDWPLPMGELCVGQAEVLYQANDLPLLTRKAFGHGQIYVLAVPTGALSDPALHRIWGQIARSFKNVQPLGADKFLAPAQATLNEIAGRPGPGRFVPLVFLGGLGVLTIFLGALLRRKRRGELVWVVLIPAAILVGVGFYYYGKMQTEDQRVAYIGLICALEGNEARVQEVFASYSGPEARKTTFTTDSPRGTISDVGRIGGVPAEQSEVRTAEHISLPDSIVPPDSTRLFVVDTVAEMQLPTLRVTFDEHGLTGTADSPMPETIETPVIYTNRRTYRLPSLPPGQTEFSVRDDEHRLGEGEFTGSLVQDSLRNSFVRELVNVPSLRRRVVRRPLLIGYYSLSPLWPQGDLQIERRGWCLLVLPIEFTAPPPGRKIVIPSGFVNLEFENVGPGIFQPATETFVPTFGNKKLLVLARLPKAISGPLGDAKAHLTVSIRNAGAYRLTVTGVRGPAKSASSHTVIRSFDSPAGKVTLEIPDAGRFRNDDGQYAFCLSVERIAGGDAEPEQMSGSQWLFRSVDIVMEGISP